MKRAALATLLVVMVGLAAGTAWASVDLGEVARRCAGIRRMSTRRQSERLVDEVDDLRSAIRSADTPIYIAVLPASAADLAGGDAAEVASQLADAVGRPGTYGVVVGDRFRAGSTELPAGEAADPAQAALDANGEDTAAVLNDFVDRVADAADPPGAPAALAREATTTAEKVPPAVIAAGAGGAGLLVWRRSRRRQAEAAERADGGGRSPTAQG